MIWGRLPFFAGAVSPFPTPPPPAFLRASGFFLPFSSFGPGAALAPPDGPRDLEAFSSMNFARAFSRSPRASIAADKPNLFIRRSSSPAPSLLDAPSVARPRSLWRLPRASLRVA